ncbi:MAG: NosD domain-containing protein [Candidatus Kariarchaeaceae archaeon]
MINKRKKGLMIGLLVIMLSTSTTNVHSKVYRVSNQEITISSITNILTNNHLTEIPLLLNYTSHEPIVITNDDELAEIASNGMGTENDPFVISGWEITGLDFAIQITKTTMYFIIKECLLKSFTGSTTGIAISEVANGTAKIEKNVFQNNSLDIDIINCNHLIIHNNSMTNSQDSIAISNSNNNQISENNFSVFNKAIYIDETSNTLICNNSFLSEEGWGIDLDYTSNTTIHNNFIRQSRGITEGWDNIDIVITNNVFNNCEKWAIYYSGMGSFQAKGILANNKFYKTGIYIFLVEAYELIKLEVYNNTVNDLPLGWLTHEKNITLTEKYGQLFLLSCSDIIIEKQDISNCTIGIVLISCYDITIKNNTCEGCNEGITICYSYNIDVYNNSLLKNLEYGINLASPLRNLVVSNNTCYSNKEAGIYGWQIYINLIISNNNCMNNGIGVELRWVDNAIIINNTLKFNIEGIQLSRSEDCEIIGNKLIDNDVGIVMYYESNDNLVYNNAFVDNNLQAYDEGEDNQWCNLEIFTGNYWSDYSGTGSYKISGSVNAEDYCPLNEQMEPYPGVPFTTIDDVTLDDEEPINRSSKSIVGSSENLIFSIISSCFIIIKIRRKKHS